MDPLSIARYGMMTAESRLAASAARVAAGSGGGDVVQECVEQTLATGQFAASAKVVAFTGETWRALMDVQRR